VLSCVAELDGHSLAAGTRLQQSLAVASARPRRPQEPAALRRASWWDQVLGYVETATRWTEDLHILGTIAIAVSSLSNTVEHVFIVCR